ncbi:unnamed protein product [Trichobilharzia szidati]|nr:unnamed protein product [Trichobilharzia szidati]
MLLKRTKKSSDVQKNDSEITVGGESNESDQCDTTNEISSNKAELPGMTSAVNETTKSFNNSVVKRRVAGAFKKVKQTITVANLKSSWNTSSVSSLSRGKIEPSSGNSEESSWSEPQPLDNTSVDKVMNLDDFITSVLRQTEGETVEALYDKYLLPSLNERIRKDSSVQQNNANLETREEVSDKLMVDDDVNLDQLMNDAIKRSLTLSTSQVYKEYFESATNDKIYEQIVRLGDDFMNTDQSNEDNKVIGFILQNSETDGQELLPDCSNGENGFTDEKQEISVNNKENDLPLHGTWVECVLCLKWRFLEEILDPSLLIESWHCGLQQKYKTTDKSQTEANVYAINPCDEPQQALETDEISNSYVYTKFTAGSLVWAKLDGYPEWPAMIDCDATGQFAEFDEETREVIRYSVVFLDPNLVTRQSIRANRIRKYLYGEEEKISKSSRFYHALRRSIEEIEKASHMSLEERIYTYGYPYSENKNENMHEMKKIKKVSERKPSNKNLTGHKKSSPQSKKVCISTMTTHFLCR